MSELAQLEELRLRHQSALDAERSSLERNKLGQYATPSVLAEDIAQATLNFASKEHLRFLEPSLGSGAFFSALLRCGASDRLRHSLGVELDQRFVSAAHEIWGPHGLDVVEGDFTNWALDSDYQADLLIANPPYVRHHHLSAAQKVFLLDQAERVAGIRPSGLAGLYVYFVLLSHRVLAPGAVSSWLIPSEFLDVNYGKALKQYLRDVVTTIQVHRFDPLDVQFDDALVTSTVVVFQNTPPRRGQVPTRFTHGGSVCNPASSRELDLSGVSLTAKWSRCWTDSTLDTASGPVLGDVFKVRRGIATGANKFFIRPRSEIRQLGIPEAFVQPILPSSRYISSAVIESDDDGWPANVNQLGLLGSSLQLDELQAQAPSLSEYFQSAPPAVREAYLVRGRRPWYRHELREASPFLCTYMGRGVDDHHPFRFIRNRSDAIATNVFLMLYPVPEVRDHLDQCPASLEALHEALLSYTASDLRRGGRVYGGGLHKMEPKELTQLPAERLINALPIDLDFDGQQTLWD